MECIDPINTFNNIKEKYLSFVLTTVCRNNKRLYDELKQIFTNQELLWRDLILQSTPKYLSCNKEEYNKLDFDNKFKEYLKQEFSKPYQHQISAWKTISNGNNCVVATGTGSGKTEAFIMPAINECVTNRYDGVQTIIIYPLKALANDQGKRIGELLDKINDIYDSNIKYGIFDGDTGKRNSSGNKSEINTKKEIISKPPNVLITNYVMLERLLLNPEYISILKKSKIKFIILDEIHYYRGAQGIDVSLLMRRLQFQLSLQQDISKIQYLGTSATLGNSGSDEVNTFLFKLFNTEFKQNSIITPTFNKDFEKDLLFEPKYYNEIKDDFSEINKKEIRSHSFFCAPPTLYRCNSCNKIHLTEIEQCDVCDSKLIFQISTCRQCGEEYFVYHFDVPVDQKKSEIIFNDLDIDGHLEVFRNEETQNEGKDIILLKKELDKSNKKLKICKSCLSLHSEIAINCEKCGNEKFMEVYSVENHNTKPINLKQKINDKYCPSCGFKEKKQSLIVPLSKISDENCSHIIFDELFMSLPDKNRKLLVFTDNVQRSSKFAREIVETHLKNIARSELQKKIENLTEPKPLDILMFEIISGLRRKTTIDKELELNLKKELYDELMGAGKKVASLANRGIFKLQITDLDSFPEIFREKIKKAFELFKEKNQLLAYYDIVNNEEIQSWADFYDKKTFKEKLYREINNLKGKQLKDVDFSEVETIIQILLDKNFLDEKEEKYFFKEVFIEVCKLEKEDHETNYYDEWKKIDTIPILKSEIDTGKTSPEKRTQIESDFKMNRNLNFLVSTPTLELGIDIGDLEVVGLLYAPPSPAQYVQRIGRSGRKGQSSLAITYLSKRTLDFMYFNKPKDLVEGKIMPPNFVLELDLPLKKAMFSLFFSYILQNTDFEKKYDWTKIATWEHKFDEIKKDWKYYEMGFQDHLKKYLENSNISLDSDELLAGWIEKLQEHINLQKSLNYRYSQKRQDIFNYFKEAGLLPDYAFGSGGSMVLVNNMDPITGYKLYETCPPSTLDHNKFRYNCNKIDLNTKKIKIIADEFKYCSSCRELIFINTDKEICPICNNVLNNNTHNTIIEPKIIRAKRSTHSLTQKRVKWSYKAINLPDNIYLDNNIISDPITCEIGMFFEFVIVNGKPELYLLCDTCGEFYLKNSSKSKESSHIHKQSNKRIGTKFTTRAVIIDYSTFNINTPFTFLNALISAASIESGCEDGEIGGFDLQNSSKLIIFDNIEGGVGFVDVISKRWANVIRIAKELCEETCCENGCIKCIGSFWRQNELKFLRKKEIIPILNDILEQK